MKTFSFVTLILISFMFLFTTAVVDRSFFTILGLQITATQQEVQAAYQSKKDKINAIQNQQEKQKKSKLLEQVFNALINSDERQKYERYGKDIFKGIKKITSINQYTGADSRKGKTMKFRVPISIQQLYNGTTIQTQYQTKQACSRCLGTGAQSPKSMRTCNACSGKGFNLINGKNAYGQPMQFEGVCPNCHGTGKIIQKSCSVCKGKRILNTLKTIKFIIPPKYQGKQVIMKNAGEQQELGAPSDFTLQIVEIPTQHWRRDGNNLIYTMEVSFQQSIFGFQKTFTHLNGQQITVSYQSTMTKQTKKVFTGKGFTDSGKLTVQYKIILPKFTDRQLDMWQEFFKKYNI